jgi:ABC-type protease/lipase transport system fused ATPase/permease subunit
MLILPLYTLQIFDRVIVSESLDTLIMLLLAVIVIGFIYVTMEWYRRSILTVISRNIDEKLIRYLSCSQKKYQCEGKIFQRLSDYFRSNCFLTVLDTLFIPLVWLLLFILHPYFLSISITINATLLVVVVLSGRRSKKSNNASVFLSYAKEMMSARQRSFGLPENRISLFGFTHSNRIQYCTLSLRWILQISIPTTGAILMISHEISAGVMLAALILSMRSLTSFDVLNKSIDLYRQYKQIPESIKFNFFDDNLLVTVDEAKKNKMVTFKLLSGSGIKPYSVEFSHGFVHLISGPSGSGKSRLARVLAARYSSASEIENFSVFYSDINQTDVGQLWLSKNIGYIGEYLVAVNIPLLIFVADFCSDNFSQAKIICKDMGISEKYFSNENGMGPIISEQGFSSGMLAAIYLARLVCMNPDYIVIDNIDAVMDQALLTRYLNLLQEFKQKEKLVIICSHRQSMFKSCDQLHLLDHGNLIYSGRADKVYACEKNNIIATEYQSNKVLKA